jgi:RNA polymerase sigma-70 factor, ECF subfamily
MDEQNFSEAYATFAPIAMAKALRMLNNTEEAREITQDVMLKMHVHYQKFCSYDNKTGWIYCVTTNACINFIRKQRRYQTNQAVTVEMIPSETDMEIQLVDANQLRELFRLVPEKYHEYLVYYYADGMTQEEIADVMQISRVTVARAMIKLKTILGQASSEIASKARQELLSSQWSRA